MPRARKSTTEATPETTKNTAASTPSRSRKGRRSEEPAGAPLPVLTSDEIARRAYELYERSGFQQGHDLDHWLSAERELQGS